MFWGIQNIAFLLYASDIDFYDIDVSFLPYCFHLWSHTVGFRSTLCNAVSNTGLYKHNYFWSEGERGVKIEAWSTQCAKYCRTTAEFKRHYFKSMEEGCSNTTFKFFNSQAHCATYIFPSHICHIDHSSAVTNLLYKKHCWTLRICLILVPSLIPSVLVIKSYSSHSHENIVLTNQCKIRTAPLYAQDKKMLFYW